MILAATAALVWSLRNGEVTPLDGAREPRHVGSLQKAWVVKAWASTHPDEAPLPRVTCDASSRCWLAPGHASVGLRRATALSCNTFFRALAGPLAPEALREALAGAGFEVDGALDEATAIGLDGPAASVTITPSRLLRAYAELVSTPWSTRDDLRREWLDGMRDAAEDGTAAALGLRGLLAKTGTVRGGNAATSGWAIAVDPSGTSAWLAFVSRGTGRDAMASLGRELENRLPSAARKPGSAETVRVRLFEALRGAEVCATNTGEAPAARTGSRESRWVGPGGRVPLARGETLGDGLWRLELPEHSLVRLVRGALEGRRPPVLVTTPREYVDGVIRGELASASPPRAVELGGAVLRFLARGKRHGHEDVCDLTHCARFVGLGPPVEWLTPTSARVLGPAVAPAPYLDDAAWARARELASEPGPSLWTGSCGGAPLSERAVWGHGSAETFACPRHGPGSGAVFTRRLPAAALKTAFGSRVVSLEAVEREGVRRTRVALTDGRRLSLLYDELHARLAPSLGWDSLPAPPDRFLRTGDGFEVQGVGAGHRVGVCLTD